MSVTHVAIVRDHSASMRPLVKGAANDFNLLLEGIQKERNVVHNISGTIVGCGVAGYGFNKSAAIIESNSDIINIRQIGTYNANGGNTPLWESVWLAIDALENKEIERKKKSYGFAQENVAFLVMVITDGENNVNTVRGEVLAKRIRELQATDKWTFVFRVPKGYSRNITNVGIPDGNIMEWEQTNDSLVQSTVQTVAATTSYFAGRSVGTTATKNFYTTDLSNISITEVKKELEDITTKVRSEPVWSADAGSQIRDFCENHFGEYVIGRAYYQLMKSEKIQPQKGIIIKHLKSGKYYGGQNARTMLGLPDYEVKVVPGDHHQYEIYVQSSSVNRKLVANTKVVYWG